MTPQALARLTEQSNRRLVTKVTALARRLGVTDALDALDGYKPNIKNPAQSMLRERELLEGVIDAITRRLDQEDDPGYTPPPSRARSVRPKPIAPRATT